MARPIHLSILEFMKTAPDQLDPHHIELRHRLQTAGITPTAQRLLIAAVLLARPQHLSAEQVLQGVNAAGGAVSMATVYNALNLFHSKGLIRAVSVDARKVFYDSTPGPHFHFFNEDTGELHDLDPATLQIRGIPELPTDTKQSSIDLIVRVKSSRP